MAAGALPCGSLHSNAHNSNIPPKCALKKSVCTTPDINLPLIILKKASTTLGNIRGGGSAIHRYSNCGRRIGDCTARAQPEAQPATSVSETSGNFEEAATSRLQAHYHPTVWKDEFIDSRSRTPPNYEEVSSPEHKRIQTLVKEIKAMFDSMGDGETNASAYDTAWVARVPAIDGSGQPEFPQTLQWILQNQLPDGSWGEESIFLAYDRVLNTLACVLTLTIWNQGRAQVQKGLEFISKHMEAMRDEADNHRPSGFEVVFPAMLNEAKAMGMDLPYDLPFMQHICQKRQAKLEKIPLNVLHNYPTALLYSLEGLQDVVDWNKIKNLQSADGSYLSSPASTACVFMHTGDRKCLDFLSFVLRKFGDYVPCHYPLDLFERLWVVDTVERLGIDRHFKKEIKQSLDYVYRYWDEGGIGWARENPVPDVGDTAMGLRLLRLHGYNVSSDVLKNFQYEDGDFFCFAGQTQTGVTDMLNLYRCSQVAFPGEKVMEDAKIFTTNHLQNALAANNAFDKWAVKKDLRGEVEYALQYPWHRSMPRLEARSYIEQFGSNDVWLAKTANRMLFVSNDKYLELAILDFNMIQSFHQTELQQVSRWWRDSGFNQLTFTRQRPIELYFSLAASMFEPEYSACRVVFAKASCLVTILDDLYDTYGSLQDLNMFSEAVRRWDLTLLPCLPNQLQICFTALYNTVNEFAEEGFKAQGRDILGYLRKIWQELLASFTIEAEWSEAKFVPTFEEYMENGKVSAAVGTLALNAIFFAGELLPDHILQQVDYRSKFMHLVCLTGRLINDTKTFQAEKDRGELASSIQCYMRENPECTEEEALKHVYGIIQHSLLELSWEFSNPASNVPVCIRKLLFNTARVAQLFYMYGDGFGIPEKEMKDHVRRTLFEPVA